MRRQTETIAPAAVAALLALFAATVPNGAARAADDCIAAPNADAPPGSRWYYRTDRATKKKCWHVSQGGEKSAGATPDAAAPDAGAPDAPAQSGAARSAGPPETVGRGHPAHHPASVPRASASADPPPDRECDIAQSVLNYRKILATVFPTDSASTAVHAQTRELAAKGCRP